MSDEEFARRKDEADTPSKSNTARVGGNKWTGENLTP